MGAVYEASHARLDGRYAVKFLHPDFSSRHPAALARFRREARITSALRHPGIVQVIDFNTPADGPPFLVMEYLEGQSLGKVIAREAPFPLSRVVDITGQIASALSAVHRQGVIHRDLNPSNIFVLATEGDQPERVKVFDFGISKIRWASKNITGTLQVLGTPQYMAPEQAEGRAKDLDPAADQFSLAAIVYEMLTGHAAFTGDTLATVAYQVVHAEPEPLARFRSDLSPGLEAVLARGLAKDRRDRFESVAAFAVAFGRAANPQPEDDSADRRADDPATPNRRQAADTVVSAPGFLAQLASAHRMAAARPARTPRGEERHTVILRRRRARRPVIARHAARLRRLAETVRTRRRALVAGGAVAGGGIAVLIAVLLAVGSHREPPAPRRVVVTAALPGPLVQPIPATAASSATPATTATTATPGPPGSGAGAAPPAAVAASAGSAGAAPTPTPVQPLTGLTVRPHVRPKTPAAEAIVRSDDGRDDSERLESELGFRGQGRDDSERLEGELGFRAVAAAAPGPAICSVTVGSSPWAAIWIDGKDTGKHTPVVQLAVACGKHILELRRRDLRLEHLATVDLRAGDHLKARYQLEPAD